MLFAGIFILLTILCFSLYVLRSYSKSLANFSHLPCMKSWHIIGDIPKLLGNNRDFYNSMTKYTTEYREPGLLCFWVGIQPIVVAFKDEYVQDVIGNTKHIEKNMFYKFLYPWLGNGLLTSGGSKWFKSRKMLTPSFHYNILNSFLIVMQNQSNILCEKLDKMVGKGEFNIRPYITNCTLDIITETAMGQCVNAQDDQNSEYIQSVNRISDIIIYQSKSPWLWPTFLFNLHPLGREAAKCLKYLHGFTDKMIEERKTLYLEGLQKNSDNKDEETLGKKKMAFLDTLLDKLHEGEIDKKDLREEVDTFMFEGHDTTAAGINWTLYFIAAYPDVQKKLQKEVDDFYGQKFAMFEEKIVLSRIIHKFNLETTQQVEELQPTFDLVLKPFAGVRVKLSHR
eukprot:XP_014780049.1 PREDICTED: cytochrome P450 4V2-like [Octopus bimaculoides]